MRPLHLLLLLGLVLLSGTLVLGAAVTSALREADSRLESSSNDAAPRAQFSRPIQVFFGHHHESYKDFAAVFPVIRLASQDTAEKAALMKLIEGPTPEEQAAGYFSELRSTLSGSSDCRGEDFSMTVNDGAATVRFCRAVSSAGVGQDARIRSQIEATLLQFPTIQRITLLTTEGRCLFDESGLDLCREA
jgi:hypothetical protein